MKKILLGFIFLVSFNTYAINEGDTPNHIMLIDYIHASNGWGKFDENILVENETNTREKLVQKCKDKGGVLGQSIKAGEVNNAPRETKSYIALVAPCFI